MNNEHRQQCSQLADQVNQLQTKIINLVKEIEDYTPLTNHQGKAKQEELKELKSAVTEISLCLEYIDNAIKI